ncbi:hypothetical protein [Bradyrhizobium sp. AS23.2]|uniref:hypothetical protein n=1 Tax=Bradyrhizobium sp. AS23.2 TaxID=1680155 RepID=UPI0011613776|nr:hypothetical protein [Bradyrhizobium sp. AS23.2]
MDDDIVLVFCPTSQIAAWYRKSLASQVSGIAKYWYRKSLIPQAPATLHGVVFDIFAGKSQKGVARNDVTLSAGAVPIRLPPRQT